MNKKAIAGVIAGLCLAIPFGVSAANDASQKTKPENRPAHIDISKLTDTQKADLQAQMEKMIQLKKETVQKMIDNGSITKEQGDIMLQRLDERLKSIQEGNLEFGKGMRPENQKKDFKGHKKGQTKDQSQQQTDTTQQ